MTAAIDEVLGTRAIQPDRWIARLRSLDLVSPRPTGYYAGGVVRIGLVMRLVALTAAVFSMRGPGVTLESLLGILLVSLTSFAVLFFPSAGRLLIRHPILVVADSILAFTILAMLGPGSPVGLATILTALVLGAFFGRVMSITFGALLLSLYALVLLITPETDLSFMTILGLPVIYVCFLAVGIFARIADDTQERLSAQVVAEREARAGAEERARLARELHDSVGKTLYGISMLASAASRSLDRGDRATEQLELISQSAREAAEEARGLIELQRSDSADQSLRTSIETSCARWSERSGVRSEVLWTGRSPADRDLRHEVVAILLEALENISRHAHATTVRVKFDGAADQCTLEIVDDGVGFDVEFKDGLPVEPLGHYGLIGMVERARRCDGDLDLISNQGQGTTVRLRVGTR